ncbi:MAG TPA: SusC/RagA family TonB-linked outer membrane protein [Gemmatimonadaceae bacterium]|jgi:TonB-linked SusC/RagA family outer membrane protein|nr:SusC/RagA family TonB-linked outer membrane protein [Gemmatimonadaceae bacterium]
MTSNLYRMLAGAGLMLGMVPAMASAQQATTVSGRVTNEASAPVPGASVSIPSLGVGSYTGNDGRFTFTVAANRATGQNVSLVARRIGYQPVTAAVTLSGATVSHDFRLSTATTQLEGVVVTALGLEREKRSLGIAAQSVQGSDLNKTQTPNIVNALSGKVAGVKVVGSTNFGGSARVVIRGENSISGNNQPLWVVDGIPIDNSNFTNTTQARGYGGYDYGNATQDLNTEDIESVSVLKGPAAAALYGSRAANGAIVVTTRSGKGASRGFQATASSNVTFDNISKLPDYQNGYGQGTGGEFEYLDGQGNGNGDGTDESWGPKLDAGLMIPQWFSNGQPAPWVSHPNNVRDFFRRGTTVSNNISATGSGDRANFRLSFGAENMDGIVPTSNLKRITAGINGTASLSEKLQANASVQYVRNKANNRPGTGYDELNPIMGFTWFGRQVDSRQLQALVTDSTLQAYNRGQGIDFTNQVNWNYNYHNNPYWNLTQNQNYDDRNRFIGSAQVQYKPTSWLTGMVRSGSDFYNNMRANNIAQGWIGGFTDGRTNGDFTGGGFTNETYFVNENNTDFLLTAVTTPLERLGLTLNLGGNRRTRSENQRWIGTDKLVTGGVYNMSNAATIYPAFQYDERRQINSLYGTTQFAFNDYFFVDVTGRNDWSSTLPKGKNSYFYPSVSSSLVFTDLMPALKIGGLSYGKLRGAWTRVGSDANPYLLATTYASNAPYFGQPRFTLPATVSNPELKPEQTQAWEVGTELSFLDGRAGLDLTYYTKRTTDQILTASVAPSTGFTAAAVNAGALSNKGIEVQLTGSPIKMNNGFTWDVTANYAHNTNKLESLYGASDTYLVGSKFFNTSIEARVGQPYGSIVGFPFRRDSATHQLVLSSSTGTPLRATTTTILGNIQPKWTGGLINTFRYKSFDISGQVDARIGGQLYSATNAWGKYAGILASTLQGREDSVTVSGVLANGTPVTKKVSAENYWHGQGYNSGDEGNIYDASFVKLRELRIGWAVPQSLLRGMSAYRLNVALVGRNLLTHSNAENIDPETAFSAGNQQGLEFGQLPATRSLGFQISVTP